MNKEERDEFNRMIAKEYVNEENKAGNDDLINKNNIAEQIRRGTKDILKSEKDGKN